MKIVKCYNQKELDAALAESDVIAECWGDGYFKVRGSSTVTACDSSTVTACDSSTVTAYDSSTVTACDSSTVTAYGSSTVRACGSSTVTACDSSTVTAYDSSTVTACGSSTVRACGSSTVTACGYVAVHIKSDWAKVSGGVQIKVPKITDAQVWCDVYGGGLKDGVMTVFKAVGDDYKSARGGDYTPGTIPVASDWDGGKAECGGGLHFSPHPAMALAFAPEAKRFLACPVSVDDVVFHADARMPEKIKARGCCAPVWEVDIDGNPIESAARQLKEQG